MPLRGRPRTRSPSVSSRLAASSYDSPTATAPPTNQLQWSRNLALCSGRQEVIPGLATVGPISVPTKKVTGTSWKVELDWMCTMVAALDHP